MPDKLVQKENIDRLHEARRLAARIVSSIDSKTWSLRDIKKSAKKIVDLLDAPS